MELLRNFVEKELNQGNTFNNANLFTDDFSSVDTLNELALIEIIELYIISSSSFVLRMI